METNVELKKNAQEALVIPLNAIKVFIGGGIAKDGRNNNISSDKLLEYAKTRIDKYRKTLNEEDAYIVDEIVNETINSVRIINPTREHFLNICKQSFK